MSDFGKDINVPSKDIIYRQDAINAVKIGALSAATIYGRTDEGSTALYETVKAIKALPPIIHCRDCKFTDGEKPIADGRYWCVLHESFMYFCSDAERGQ